MVQISVFLGGLARQISTSARDGRGTEWERKEQENVLGQVPIQGVVAQVELSLPKILGYFFHLVEWEI